MHSRRHEDVPPVVDAHVHVYESFDVQGIMDFAWGNLLGAAAALGVGASFQGVLLLCETARDDWFLRQVHGDGGEAGQGSWCFQALPEEPGTLLARQAEKSLLIMAGRQVVTAEGLEVLALMTQRRFDDGMPLRPLLQEIHATGGLPVIPWAVGKWLGRRGRLLADLLEDAGEHRFFLGDNGGRPVFWRNPGHFRLAAELGIKILPGSDPLPLPRDAGRVGSYGFSIDGRIGSDRPAADLKALLYDGSVQIRPFGQLEAPGRFFHNQLALRLRKFSSGGSAAP